MRKKTLAILLLSSAACLAGCSGSSENVTTTVAEGTTTASTTADNTDTPETTVNGTTSSQTNPDETDAPETDAPETDASETNPVETTSDLSGIFESEVGNPTINASPITFVTKGVKYTSPSDYMVMYADGIGPVVYINNVFQMKMVRKDTAFSEVLDTCDTLDDKSISAGAKSVVEPTITTIGEKKFVYFVVMLDDEKTMGILSESPDGSFSIGGQIVVQSDKVSYDDMLKMYASIAATAEVTDEDDSTDEDISSQIKFITGEKRDKSTLTYENCTVTFKVPDGYYFTSDTSSSTSGTQFFSSANLDVQVSIDEKAFPEDTAEVSIDAMVQYEENAVKIIEKIGNRTVYICTSHYTSETNGKVYYDITCRSDIDDEYTYVVSADYSGDENGGDISFDEIKTFFELED